MKKLIATLVVTSFAMGSALAQSVVAPAKPAVATAVVAAPASAAVSSKAATPAASATPAAPAASAKPVAKAAPMTEAAGGGTGKVWINSKSNTYHCQGTKFYGKTKAGEYMSEADAKAKGAHADHGKACK
ncbi:hypothetical protein BH11PSE12_BH11PSE12_24200 [soil metagenome]